MTFAVRILKPIAQICHCRPGLGPQAIHRIDSFAGITRLPRINSSEIEEFNKQAETLKSNLLQGLKITENFSPEERKELADYLINEIPLGPCTIVDDMTDIFMLMATGNKPAMLHTATLSPKLAALMKHNGYDTIGRFVLDRNAVKKVIGDNIDIYRNGLGLDKNSSVEDLYKMLSSKDSPLIKDESPQDIIGLTLGFPRDNVIIFHLVDVLKSKNKTASVKNIKKLLMSQDSPYKGFSDEFKRHLLQRLDSIKQGGIFQREIPRFGAQKFVSDNSGSSPYNFSVFVDEPGEINRIIQSIRNALSKLKEINNASDIC